MTNAVRQIHGGNCLLYTSYNCEWWELDSKTGAISADFFSGAFENKITAFEAGKTYHYGVYVKAVGYVESENTTYVFGPNTNLKIKMCIRDRYCICIGGGACLFGICLPPV